MTRRHHRPVTMLVAAVLLQGCAGSSAAPSQAPSLAPTPSAASTPTASPTPKPSPSADPTVPGDGVADPSGRIAFGRYTRYDDFFGPP
jgi:hypothetical protein